MRTHFATALLLASSAYAALTITSPAINQCQDSTFTITGAEGDIQLTILPSDNPCAHDGLLIQDGFSNGDATLYNINITAGTSVVVIADDAADGQEVWSSVIVVGGSAADCATSTSTSHTTTTTAAAAATAATTSTHHTSVAAPVNIAGPTTTPTSGAVSLQTPFGFGTFVALAALVFNA